MHVDTDPVGSAKNPFPYAKSLAAAKEDGNYEQPETHKKNNPWGNYNSTLDNFAFSLPPALPDIKQVPVSTEPVFLENPKLAKPECNLIDLEVGLESSSASPSLRYLKSNNISEVSLIDMDDSQLKQVKPKLRQIQHLKKSWL